MAKPLVVHFQSQGAGRRVIQPTASRPVRVVRGNVIRWQDARQRRLASEETYLRELEKVLGISRPGEDGEQQTGAHLEGRAFTVITVVAVVAYLFLVGRCLYALLGDAA